MKKIIDFVKSHLGITIIILIALFIRVAIINELGIEYTLKSDDLAYMRSGIRFLEEGRITMHGVSEGLLSAQIMPGMTFLIAFIALIVGGGYKLTVTLKIIWIVMGLLNIFFVYKTVNIYASKFFSCLAAVFFLGLDFSWLDTVILTETPSILILTILIYNSLLLAKTNGNKYFWTIVVSYVIGVFIKPNIGIYPVFLVVYLLWYGYDKKVLIRQVVIAGGVLLCCLAPWTIRNYYHFNKFIPLTYGVGNPLLLGTYQGYGYPTDEELDYKENIDKKIPKVMYDYVYGYNVKKEYKYMRKYYWLEYDSYKAKYRMQEWWKKNPRSMIYSYTISKPWILIYGTYSIDVLGIPKDDNLKIRNIELCLFIISMITIILDRRRIKEMVFLLSFYISQIAIYSYTYAFSRYGMSLYSIRFIIIGIGCYTLYDYLKPYVINKFVKPRI